MKRRVTYIACGLGVVLIFLIAVMASASRGDRADPSSTPLLGKPAPAIAGKTLDDSAFTLAGRKGSWLAVNFFSTTCTPCVNEHPALVTFNADQELLPVERRTELVTVVFQDKAANVRKFFAANGGGTWPVVLDDLASISFGVARVPETWIIDDAGVVRQRLAGQLTTLGLQTAIDTLRTTP